MTKSIFKKIEFFLAFAAAVVLILSIGVYIGSRSKTITKPTLFSAGIDKY